MGQPLSKQLYYLKNVFFYATRKDKSSDLIPGRANRALVFHRVSVFGFIIIIAGGIYTAYNGILKTALWEGAGVWFRGG